MLPSREDVNVNLSSLFNFSSATFFSEVTSANFPKLVVDSITTSTGSDSPNVDVSPSASFTLDVALPKEEGSGAS